MYQIANEFELFLGRDDHAAFGGREQDSLAEAKNQGQELIEKMETSFRAMSKSQVRRSGRRTDIRSGRRRSGTRVSQKASLLLLLTSLFAFSAASNAFADNPQPVAEVVEALDATVASGEPFQSVVSLNDSQRETILAEASEAYTKAVAISETDSAEANDLFITASAKYQLLVDSGVTNSGLYMNLGNAYLQSNQLGHAIASYERAARLDPTNRQLKANLELATSLVKGATELSASTSQSSSMSLQAIMAQTRIINDIVTGFTGLQSMVWLLVFSSLLFWGVFIARAAGFQSVAKRWAIVPLLLFALSLASVQLSQSSKDTGGMGIIVSKNVTLHRGDGEQFEPVHNLEDAEGHRVEVLVNRGNWTQVKTRGGHVGWVEHRQLEFL